MKINVSCSPEGIESAIRRLEKAKDNLRNDLQNTVEILATEGATIVNMDNGSMSQANVTSPINGHDAEKMQAAAEIFVGGKVPLIAEFGAGDATLEPSDFFENGNIMRWTVFPGSYSLFKGIMWYWRFHDWPFGGRWYTEVPPRHGLFNAKLWIMENSSRVASEVIKL